VQIQILIPYYLGQNTWVQIISNMFAGIDSTNLSLKENILTY